MAVNVLRGIGGVRVGDYLDSGWVIRSAVRVCINVLQGYTVRVAQFVHFAGVSVELDRLVSGGIAAGLFEGRPKQGDI